MRTCRALTIFILFIAAMSLSFPVASQDLGRRIRLDIQNQPLEEVIRQLSDMSGVRFSYSPQIIDVQQKITVCFKDLILPEALNLVLQGTGISWKVVKGQVVLKACRSGEGLTGEENGPPCSMQGFVVDKVSGEALIGANVYVPGTPYGVATNAYGFFSLSVPAGPTALTYSYMGYVEKTDTLLLTGDTTLSTGLEESSLGMGEVVITASRTSGIPGIDRLSDFSLSGRTLSRLPGFAGDEDVIKALHVLPGIRAFGDGSSLYYVRGGNYDQNLLMIDGAPIYNPSHLFGFFSAISPDAVNDMKIYKGDFPARYGGRASSVIDITAREGNMKKLSIGGNLGPYASSLTLEGPLARDRSSFLLSGRLSTLNWLNGFVDDESRFKIYFYDINAKINARVSSKDRLFLTFYYGQDDFERTINSVYRSYGIRWDNLAGTFRWNHLFSSRVFSNLNISYSDYRYYLFLSSNRKDYWNSGISGLSGRYSLSWFLNNRNTVRTGIHVSQHHSNPGNIRLGPGSESSNPREVSPYQSMEYAYYLSNEQKVGSRLFLNYGLRISAWQDLGPTTVYYFDVNHEVIDTLQVSKNKYYALFIHPEPRMSVSYRTGERSTVKAGYSRSVQYMQILSNGTGPFTSLEVWAPAGPNIKPLQADQYSAGYFLDFGPEWSISAEGYFKKYSDHLDYARHADLLYNPLLEGELRFGKARAYGLECMVQKRHGNLTGWLGYTYSRALTETPGVNGGKEYPASFDSPHNISLFLHYTTGKRWSFSANWQYMTGTPFTMPRGFYYYDGYSVPYYGEKNDERLPDYHRLDLSVSYRLNRPENRYSHRLILSLYNAYGRSNPFSISFNKFRDSDGNYVVPSNLEGEYERVPTKISVAGIIPSINYQFRFK
ncbi:MAG: TonB-dependent receptor [Bacteroidales bacterium]